MIIDSHAHFEPRMLEVDRVISKMDAVGVDRIALIPAMNDPLPHTPEKLLRAARVLMNSSIGRPLAEVLHRATLTAEGDLRLGGTVYRIYAQPDNASVADIVAEYPDRFLGWIFLNPRTGPSALEQLERWHAHPGMIGVKLHPHWHDYRTDRLTPVLTRCEELGLPVLIHLGFRGRGDFRAMAQQHPKLTIIAAHAGFPFYKQLWAHASQMPNLYVDLSSPYIDETLARRCVAAMGPQRCLYGTDSPYGFHADDGSYDYEEIKGWVDRLPVSARERDGIFGTTFAELASL